MRWTPAAKSGRARAGTLETPHGTVPTPAFMPVGTQATLKALTPDQVRATGARMVLSNAYHLHLRPGADLVARLGGLHRFMAWDGPILTDSGGFQVFSLADLRKVTDEGVRFRNPIDGTTHFITPEKAMEIERNLGADVAMAFDECPPGQADAATAGAAVDRTTRWAERCLAAHAALPPGPNPGQGLFGIVQGGVHLDLRTKSARAITAMPFAGYAIGGLSVGEAKVQMYPTLAHTAELLPEGKARYLMGVGTPEDLVVGVALGVDLFDCVLPTRLARHGTFFGPPETEGGPSRFNVKNARFREDPGPLVEGCDCATCRTFSRAYVCHLVRCQEFLAHTLLSIHNVRFLVALMEGVRQSILAGTFPDSHLAWIPPEFHTLVLSAVPTS